MSALLAALRIARRDARRHKWRSLLVVALILVPVAAATGVDVLYRTATSAEAERERAFGGADAIVSTEGCGRTMCVDGPGVGSPPGTTAEQLAAALPPGSRWVRALDYSSFGKFTSPGRLAEAQVMVSDHIGDPLLRGDLRLVAGQAPRAGDEVAISPPLADRLGIDDPLGATLTALNGTTARIVGVVRDPDCLSCPRAAVATTSPLAAGTLSPWGMAGYENLDADPEPRFDVALYVDLPAHLHAAKRSELGSLDALNALVELRALYGIDEESIGDYANRADLTEAAILTMVAGLGMLEIVLLASVAFAVGARRQTRALGLLAAQGASPAQVRHVVLAQGVLLGSVGAGLGIATGFTGTFLARPLYERVADSYLLGWEFGAWEIAFVAVVGVLSGAAAALFPALRASRRPAVDALRGRFAASGTRSRRATFAGAGLLGLAALLSVGTARWMGEDGERGWFSYDGTVPADAYLQRQNQDDGALLLLVAVFLTVAGLLLVAPTILACLAKACSRLPITARLAGRDAHRHAHRTGPAMAAITVALGIAVGVSCLVATESPAEDAVPHVPGQVLALDARDAIVPERLAEAARAAADRIPGATAIPVLVPTDPPLPAPTTHNPGSLWVLGSDPERPANHLGVGDADLVVLASGRLADRVAATDALAAGKVVVFDSTLVAPDGNVGIGDADLSDPSRRREFARLPAVVLPRLTPYQDLPGAFVSPAVVATQGWPTQHELTLVAWTTAADAQVGAAAAAARNLGFEVRDGSGERDLARLVRVGVGAAAVLIGLFGVAVCVALAAAEGRPDLGTLSAVGAPPGRRRRLGAAAALVPAGLGTVLGLTLGYFFARAALGLTSAPTLLVPWRDLLPMLAAMPLLAAVIGVLGSLGRPPLTRRSD